MTGYDVDRAAPGRAADGPGAPRRAPTRDRGRWSLPALAGPSAWRTAAVGAIVLGAALRLLAYAEHRPLWMDELMLSTSIAWRSFGGLTRPLEYGQTAPLGFLWGARLATELAGVNEWALRAVPLLSGLLMLPLVWAAGRRLLGEREGLTALVLAVLSQPLIYYSSEVKQYAGDACVTAALLWVAARVLEAPGDRRRWWWLTAAGVAALVFSQTAVFVLAAIGLVLCASVRVRRTPGWLVQLALPGALWASLFLALFATVYHSAATSAYMQQVWGETFLTPRAPDLGARVYAAARDVLVQSILPVWPEPTRAQVFGATGAFLIGVIALWRRYDRAAAALITLPFLFVVIASALERYPIEVRVLLFLSPLVFLVYGAALAAAVDVLPKGARAIAYVALVGLLVYWRQEPVREGAVRPRRYEDTRDVIAEYPRRAGADPAYVYVDGVPSWAFYTTDWSAPDTTRLAWLTRRAARAGDDSVYASRGRLELVGRGPEIEWRERRGALQARPAAGWAESEARRIQELAARGARGRWAWVYFSHFSGPERDELLAALRRRGGRIVRTRTEDTAALYHLRFDPLPT